MSVTPEMPKSDNHDEKGRFTKGNPGGRGNPYNKQMARFRRILMDCVTDQDMHDLGRELVRQAVEGSMPAIKLILQYVIGKPGPFSEVDWNVPMPTPILPRPLPIEPNKPAPATMANPAKPVSVPKTRPDIDKALNLAVKQMELPSLLNQMGQSPSMSANHR